MVTAGLGALSPEDQANLNQLAAKSLREQEVPINLDEITYLQEYIDINERFMNQQLNTGSARREINTLNEKYSHLHESVKRTDLLGSHLANGDVWNDDIEDYEDGWVPSAVCW
jgi:hypothetical protein